MSNFNQGLVPQGNYSAQQYNEAQFAKGSRVSNSNNGNVSHILK
jgi:hypothetical protein